MLLNVCCVDLQTQLKETPDFLVFEARHGEKFPRTWTPVPKTEIEWLKPNSLKVIRASRPRGSPMVHLLKAIETSPGVFGCADV